MGGVSRFLHRIGLLYLFSPQKKQPAETGRPLRKSLLSLFNYYLIINER